jgi:hypothetical protein
VSFFFHKPPWYAAGLAFQCARCGRCCAGPEDGYVWANDAEIAAISAHLGISIEELHHQYLRRARGRCTIVMRPDNKDCPFLSPAGNGPRTCAIYPVRPMQCRTWPFWPVNMRCVDDWMRAGMRCPGINRGATLSCDEIKAKLNAVQV